MTLHCTGRDICRVAKTMHCMQYATDIKLHVHTYAVGVADTAAREGSPHNVLHSSSMYNNYHTRHLKTLTYSPTPIYTGVHVRTGGGMLPRHATC